MRRPEVAELIRRAREIGDITDDSGQYEAAKDAQMFLEGRIRQLEDSVRRAVIIEDQSNQADGRVRIGSTVVVIDSEGLEERWTIVGQAEADAAHGRISNESPVGGALVGKEVGDSVQIETPLGTQTFTVSVVD